MKEGYCAYGPTGKVFSVDAMPPEGGCGQDVHAIACGWGWPERRGFVWNINICTLRHWVVI